MQDPIIVIEILLNEKCRHGRIFKILNYSDYHSRGSVNAFFFGTKKRNIKNKKILYYRQLQHDYLLSKFPERPMISVDSVWEFYKFIGYCYKTKKYK